MYKVSEASKEIGISERLISYFTRTFKLGRKVKKNEIYLTRKELEEIIVIKKNRLALTATKILEYVKANPGKKLDKIREDLLLWAEDFDYALADLTFDNKRIYEDNENRLYYLEEEDIIKNDLWLLM